MRVLHVTEVHWGGVVNLLQQFTSVQSGRGHEVHILAPAALSPALHGNHHNWDVDRRKPLSYVAAARQLRRVACEVEPDVIHLHSFMAGLIGRLPGVLAVDGPPVVYQPHAWAFAFFKDSKKAFLVKAWERWGNSRTTLLVANCTDELVEGRTYGIENDSYPVGVSIDLDHFVPPTAEQRREARIRMGVGAPRMILVLGRLAHQKGQDLVLPYWEQSPIEQTALVLVGRGDGRRLAELAPSQWENSVFAVGETDDARAWIWASDLLLLPSRYETVSLVVGEAMACGVPVVATAVNGTREVVVDGPIAPAGAVVNRNDVPGLLAACRARLDDNELWRAESGRARHRAEKFFDPQRVAVNLETAYAAAMAKQARAHSSQLRSTK